MMAAMGRVILLSVLLLLLLVVPRTLALQVTPNSPCSLICMDNPTQDVSDPDVSNTYPSDIVCSNADYQNTPKGQKFEACVNCLRNSTASASGENDQSWFLYNIRYGLDTCLFGSSNVTDAVSTPCITDTACGPLQQALGDGNLNPANESTYSYCSADNNALLGAALSSCTNCLQDITTETYLANFLLVLQAGCVQQPAAGTFIGTSGNIFSSSPINITYPGDNPNPSSRHHKSLSQGAIVGIVAGAIALVVVSITLLFVCDRKRRQKKSLKRLTSPFDPRFGSKSISTPNSGSYGNPYASPPTQISQKFDTSTLSGKELKALGLEMPSVSKQHPYDGFPPPEAWQDAHAHLEATQGHLPAYPAIPTHQAYIPSSRTAVSPTPSNTTSTTYEVSPYASSRSSPNNGPPLIKTPEVRASVSQKHQSGLSLQGPGLPRPLSTLQKPQTKGPYPMSINTQVQPISVPRAPTPQGQTQLPLRSIVTPQQIQYSQFQQQPGMNSQVPRPALHSQRHSRHADNGPPARSHSLTGNWRRSSSRGALRDRSAERSAPPVTTISGPMIRHGGRFDSEEQERGMEDRTKSHSDDVTPSSAGSEEQWPGRY